VNLVLHALCWEFGTGYQLLHVHSNLAYAHLSQAANRLQHLPQAANRLQQLQVPPQGPIQIRLEDMDLSDAPNKISPNKMKTSHPQGKGDSPSQSSPRQEKTNHRKGATATGIQMSDRLDNDTGSTGEDTVDCRHN